MKAYYSAKMMGKNDIGRWAYEWNGGKFLFRGNPLICAKR